MPVSLIVSGARLGTGLLRVARTAKTTKNTFRMARRIPGTQRGGILRTPGGGIPMPIPGHGTVAGGRGALARRPFTPHRAGKDPFIGGDIRGNSVGTLARRPGGGLQTQRRSFIPHRGPNDPFIGGDIRGGGSRAARLQLEKLSAAGGAEAAAVGGAETVAAGGRAGKFFGGVRGAAGRGVKNAKDFAREHPIAAGLGAAGTAAFTAEPTADFMADLFSDRKLKREIQRTADLTDLDWARAMKMERLQRSNAENMGRLAALSPEVYAQLTAGRTLPRGAVVIGGVPNVDGLGAIATAMSTGQFNRGLSVEDQYLAGLTR